MVTTRTEGLSPPEPLASWCLEWNYGETLVKGEFEDSKLGSSHSKDSASSIDSGVSLVCVSF